MLALAQWAKKRYKSVKSFKNQWPPRRGKNLFKLLLVDNENEPFIKEEIAKLTQRGKHLRPDERENVTVKRTVIESDQIFTGAEGENVLLEGDAGIGKSTFCSAFISDWAKGKILKQFELLLFIPLAEIQAKVSLVTSLVEFLDILFPFKKGMCAAAAEELEDNGGENVLIVADGWDELGEDAHQQGFLNSLLINNDILPAASILLTSRHSASAQLRNPQCLAEFDRFVEVVGFNRDNIEEYIKAEFPKDPKKATDLIEQLDRNPLIESLCVVPLNCAIVCHLWRELDEAIPTTMTALYTKIIRSILIRNLSKTHPELTPSIKGLPNLTSLPEALQSQWQCLCEFAFLAIEKDKIVFSHGEVSQFFPEGASSVNDQQSCFGLLQSFESIFSDGIGLGLSFHFLHLTFQEYLAAHYLARQSPDKQLDVIQSHTLSPRFGMVWRFFFGISCTQTLTKGSDVGAQLSQEVIDAFVNNAKFSVKLALLLCHCSFESGGNFLSQEVQSKLLTTYHVRPRTAHDCTAVVSVISNTQSCDNIHINFCNCGLGVREIAAFTQALVKNCDRLQVKQLNLSGNKLTDSSVSNLFVSAAASFKSLYKLDLSNNPQLEASGIMALEDSVRNGVFTCLSSLLLAETFTRDADINAATLIPFLEAILAHCHNLCELDLSRNNLGIPGAQCLGNALAQLFGHRTVIKRSSKLFMRKTMLSDRGLCAFAQNIQASSYLMCLYLCDNNIHSVGLSSLADSISSGVLNLRDLNLDNNPIGLNGVIVIARMLSSGNCHLKWLSMCNCQLTTDCRTDTSGTNHLTMLSIIDVRQQLCQMSQNNTLTMLVVNRNNFKGGNIEILTGLMCLCHNLIYLFSVNCKIGLESFEHLHKLQDALPIIRLSYWYLVCNDICDNAVNALSKCLHLFPNIKKVDLAGNNVNNHTRMTLDEEIVALQVFSRYNGVRVVRGRDWQSGDEDGGEGHVGTVVEMIDAITDERRAVVQWDCGNRGNYCCGVDGKFDLRIFNNPGVQHDHIYCDSCEANPVIGYRWKCVECYDYDLCTSCYMAGKVVKNDLLRHEFNCIDSTYKVAMIKRVPPRAGARRVEAKGIFSGAEVVRAPDLNHGGDDGGSDELGIVTSQQYYYQDYIAKCAKLTVEVKWMSTDRITLITAHKFEKGELRCVTATSGGYYYPDHLPMLGATKTVQQEQADKIRHTQQVDDDEDTIGDDQDEEQNCDNEAEVQFLFEMRWQKVVLTLWDLVFNQPHYIIKVSKDSSIEHIDGANTDANVQCHDNLNIDDLQKVRKAIWDARIKWYDIGLELGITDPSLQVIKSANFHQPDECFTAMLRQWLQRVDPKPTWTSLVEALKSPPVNHSQLAEEIEKNYSV